MAIRRVEITSINGYDPKAPYPHVRIENDATSSVSGYDPKYFKIKRNEITHKGQIVGTHVETSVRIMSDVWADLFYAVIWNKKTGRPEKIGLGNSEFTGVFDTYQVTVDAPKSIRAKYAAWQEGEKRGKIFASLLADYDRAEDNIQEERRTIRVGKTVRVVRGYKVKRETQGIVFWMGQDNYGNTKIGIRTSDRKVNGKWADVVWVAANNCEVVL